jgi:hypothetical protein
MAVNFGGERYHSDFLPWEGRLTEFFDAGRLVSVSRCVPCVCVCVCVCGVCGVCVCVERVGVRPVCLCLVLHTL